MGPIDNLPLRNVQLPQDININLIPFRPCLDTSLVVSKSGYCPIWILTAAIFFIDVQDPEVVQ